MIGQAINDIRMMNGAHPVQNWERPLDDYCASHSKAMAKRGELYHSEEHLRKGWGEIVGESDWINDFGTTIRCILDRFIQEKDHRSCLLGWNTMGYGYHIAGNRVYLTVRGR